MKRHMMNRDIFTELKEGYTALEQARQEKVIVCSHTVEFKDNPVMTPEELSNLTVESLTKI